MKTVDIMEMLTTSIDKIIFGEWKHEGFIGGFTSERINFEIDGKEYVLRIDEVACTEHWSEKLHKKKNDCSNCNHNRNNGLRHEACATCITSYDSQTNTHSTPSHWQAIPELLKGGAE